MDNGELRDQFVKRASKELNLSEEDILTILRDQFTGYKQAKEGFYMARLREIMIKKEDALEEEEKRKEHIVLCPICGAQTYGDYRLYGKYTKTPGWKCSKGGSSHFYQEKTNKMMERLGMNPAFPRKELENVAE